MRLLTERNRRIVSGAIGVLLVAALVTVGIKAAFGAYDGGYELRGTFVAAGQGLNEGSSVAIRGVNVGEVAGIRLVGNRAEVRLRIEDGVRVPVDVAAVIRPKTLFGEKYVDLDPGDSEGTGPFLADGGVIEDTLGGFELERVLADAYPVLEAIDPVELAVLLDELATAANGLGPSIDRQIGNAAVLAELAASNDAELRQLSSDLALLTEELESVAPDVVTGARDLNGALPTLADGGDELNAALRDTSRLAGDLADLLEANGEFTNRLLTDGSRSLQVLHDRRGQVQPVLDGATKYARTLAESIRIEVGDGTLMAAVKAVVNPAELLKGLQPPPPVDGGSSPTQPVEDLLDRLLGGGAGARTSDGTGNGLLDLLAGGDR